MSHSVNGNLITTEAAGAILKLTDRQIRNMAGLLKAEKFGGVWLVNRNAVLKEKKRRDGKRKGNGGRK